MNFSSSLLKKKKKEGGWREKNCLGKKPPQTNPSVRRLKEWNFRNDILVSSVEDKL